MPWSSKDLLKAVNLMLPNIDHKTQDYALIATLRCAWLTIFMKYKYLLEITRTQQVDFVAVITVKGNRCGMFRFSTSHSINVFILEWRRQ